MDEDAKHFRRYIRLYNNMFAFTSLGGKTDAKKKGIYVFKLHVQIYHNLSSLIPGDEGPKYMLLYFYDGQVEAEKHLCCFPKLREDVLAVLMKVTELNPYARFFRSLKDISITESTEIMLIKTTVLDQRVYNAPSTNELQTQPDPFSSCIVHSTEDLLEEEARRANGGSSKSDRKISAREYYAYKLQCRPNNMILRAGRCFQQYIVDMYVKVENTPNVGRRVILPPTFIGGPRDLKKRYLNAMSLVQRFGKPDLFVTMTSNANWCKIKQQLAVGEEAQNRPDIVARVFRAKVLALKHLIKKKKVFGEVAALIYVIEFKKRGLPHAHFPIILKSDYKIKCPTDFDKFMCAEIPHVSSHYLRKTVLKHMMHDPCGQLNPECPCMKHKESLVHCKYGYPKKFSDEIRNNSDGYPMYRRKNSEEIVIVRKTPMDNRWGHDKISFNVVQSGDDIPVHDEIQQWVSPCEAAWRLCGLDMYEMHPPVLPLPIHLPNSQTINVRPHEWLTSMVSDDKRSRTCLTKIFQLNVKLGFGAIWLYNEFCEHYVWDASAKRWKKRRNKNICVGRLAFVGPSEGERYFLRLLLHNVKGPKSFEALRTVNGHLCNTFQQAALKLGLLEEDDSVDRCLQEGCSIQMPHAIRKLFATILIFCQSSDPLSLWM
ncbi:uncharacterized protein LOC110688767 [Chenopodium quinoa]|uniref:uncharacterized protein LOC110688767 n=1 Tax=Chenopodium quinoa TaxID=63459 RepID=UPI000B78D04B|nr:uncharacterized protein LOC110688767 [Chenopodium quinoa]